MTPTFDRQTRYAPPADDPIYQRLLAIGKARRSKATNMAELCRDLVLSDRRRIEKLLIARHWQVNPNPAHPEWPSVLLAEAAALRRNKPAVVPTPDGFIAVARERMARKAA